MTPRRRRNLAAALLLGLGLVGWQAWSSHLRHREPEYRGKRLTDWLAILDQVPPRVTASMHFGVTPATFGGNDHEAREAVRQMAAPALPILCEMIVSRESSLRRRFIEGWNKHAKFPCPIISDAATIERRRWLAVNGFYALGPLAEPAIPRLIPLLKATGDYRTDPRGDVACALAGIGPGAVPLLATALGNPDLRFRAITALGVLGPLGRPALPQLIAVQLAETNSTSNIMPWALVQIGGSDTNVVPVLAGLLGSSSVAIRLGAAWALARLGPGARDAIPTLLLARSDIASGVRVAVTNALANIDPGAVQAGAK